MSEPTVLTEVGGVLVVEDGPLVLVVDRQVGSHATVAFVFGILALVFGGFGAFVLIAAVAGSGDDLPAALGAVFLVVGLAAAGAVVMMLRAIRGRRDRPLGEDRPVAVFDRARQVLLDADGAVVAPLAQVQIRRKMQATSSSPKLVAATPAGDVLLAKGNPL